MKPDIYTTQTVNNMVRYITDDKMIADYTGADIKWVRLARARLPKEDGNLKRRLYPPIAEPKPPIWESQKDKWRQDAERGSAMLLDAIQRYQAKRAA